MDCPADLPKGEEEAKASPKTDQATKQTYVESFLFLFNQT